MAASPFDRPANQSDSVTANPSTSSINSECSTLLTSKPAPHSIIVNKRQKGNPILKFIRNVPWEFGDIVPDYEMGRCNCACFLSLRYHNRYPEYIHTRLKELGKSYDLRIILALNDTKQHDVSHELNQLARICLLADCTLIVAFGAEEAARYLEVYKAYENKQPTDIMPKTNKDYFSQATDCLTSIKGVNRSDASTLLSHFKSISNVIQADIDQLSLCSGIGPLKAQRLHKTFTQPFLRDRSHRPSSGIPSKRKPIEDEHNSTGNPENVAAKDSTTNDKGIDSSISQSNPTQENAHSQSNTEKLISVDKSEQILQAEIDNDPSQSKRARIESANRVNELNASVQILASDSEFSDCDFGGCDQ